MVPRSFSKTSAKVPSNRPIAVLLFRAQYDSLHKMCNQYCNSLLLGYVLLCICIGLIRKQNYYFHHLLHGPSKLGPWLNFLPHQ